jgi:hypothetical protein
MHLQINRTTMKQVFKLTNADHQTQHGFHQQPLAPGFVFAKLEVAGGFTSFLEAKIAEHDRCLVELMRDRTKGLVVYVRRIPVPSHDFASVIDQPTQLNAHDPASITFTFLAHLLGTASLTNEMDQFNAAGVDDREEGRSDNNA